MTKSQQQEWLVTCGEIMQRVQLLQAQINMTVPTDSQAYAQQATPAAANPEPVVNVDTNIPEQPEQQIESDAQAAETGEQSTGNVAE